MGTGARDHRHIQELNAEGFHHGIHGIPRAEVLIICIPTRIYELDSPPDSVIIGTDAAEQESGYPSAGGLGNIEPVTIVHIAEGPIGILGVSQPGLQPRPDKVRYGDAPLGLRRLHAYDRPLGAGVIAVTGVPPVSPAAVIILGYGHEVCHILHNVVVSATDNTTRASFCYSLRSAAAHDGYHGHTDLIHLVVDVIIATYTNVVAIGIGGRIEAQVNYLHLGGEVIQSAADAVHIGILGGIASSIVIVGLKGLQSGRGVSHCVQSFCRCCLPEAKVYVAIAIPVLLLTQPPQAFIDGDIRLHLTGLIQDPHPIGV